MDQPNLASVQPCGKTRESQSMKRTVALSPALPGSVILATASALLMGFAVADAAAQTLTNPNAPPKWSAPHADAKSRTTAQSKKACKEFGAGFVNVPGTDACVKVGGFVTVEGGSRGR
jgi:hypothetical protein